MMNKSKPAKAKTRGARAGRPKATKRKRQIKERNAWQVSPDVIFNFDKNGYKVTRLSNSEVTFVLKEVAALIWWSIVMDLKRPEMLARIEKQYGKLSSAQIRKVESFIDSLAEERLICRS